MANLSAADLYIDAVNFLILKRAQQAPTLLNLRNTVLVEHSYSDYCPVSGVFVPYQISVFARGQRLSDIAITSVTFNAGVSLADFQVQ